MSNPPKSVLALAVGALALLPTLAGLAAPAQAAAVGSCPDLDSGRVVVGLRAQEFHYNPLGSMHGGVIATMLDTAAACAVHSTLAVGEAYTSLDLTTKFLRAVTVDSGLLTCEGTVIQRGRRTALAQATLTDESGRTVAHATSSCMIFS